MSFRKKCNELFRDILTVFSPKLNTYVCYRVKFHKKLDLSNPETLDEKILWLKLNTYWNNPLIKQCADKYRVREYIKDINCQEILIPLIGVYEQPEDIPWDTLPKQYVVKLNVGCGKNIIVTDNTKFNYTKAISQLNHWKREKQWLGYSEMQYKGVKPVFLIEKYIGKLDGTLPNDYKFYCMNGESKYVMLCEGRGEIGETRFYYYDKDWNLMPYSKDALENPSHKASKPKLIDKAFEYAAKLSKDFPFVRTDLYIVDEKIYFGELTFTPSGGMDNGRLPSTDRMLGEQLAINI